MATTWIDYAVGGGIAIVGLFLFYKALKEPMDLLFATIGKGIRAVRDMFSGGVGEQYEEIRYG